ncbi:MAG TPA: hypothetical protein PKD61_00835 [Polyangiaceae bacterium]|nr:hypothetical protein [Polyangiaceae bacterium]
MMQKRAWLVLSVSLLVACSSSGNSGGPATGGSGGASGGNSGQDAGGSSGSSGDAGVTGGSGGSAGSADAGDAGTLECFEFSNNPNEPLALDGTFTTSSSFWKRPHDEPEVCPATSLLPANAADVPHVVYAFCNNDSVEHTYSFEMLAQQGPGGEQPLDDPYLVLYAGQGIPADAKQCLAINDDIPNSLNATDSEILDVKVPAGGAVTMVGTTVTYDPTDGTGQGYYILVVQNTD